MSYQEFLRRKAQDADGHGFEPTYLPNCLFDFQRALTDWAIRRGRAALMAGCGMGKTLCSLVWAENVVRHTNKPVLIGTPLAVGPQFVAEAERLDEGFHSRAERASARARGVRPRPRLSKREALATPPAFAAVLVALARSANS